MVTPLSDSASGRGLRLPRSRGAKVVVGLGLAASLGMFVLLITGDLVTLTGSQQGCGPSWPLCHGRFIPAVAVTALIEFGHRVSVALESVVLVAFAGGVVMLHRGRRPAQILAASMVGFLLLQAGMGAWAVMVPQQPVVLALHFGISLVALASTAVATAYVHRPEDMHSASATLSGVSTATWGVAVYLYLVVYSGALVMHTGSAPACPGWPLCGAGATAITLAAVLSLAHRLAASLSMVFAVGLVLAYRRFTPSRPDLITGGWLLVAALLGQVGVGAFLVFSGWSLASELLHAAVTGATFAAAAYLCLRVTVHAGRETAAADPRLTGVATRS